MSRHKQELYQLTGALKSVGPSQRVIQQLILRLLCHLNISLSFNLGKCQVSVAPSGGLVLQTAAGQRAVDLRPVHLQANM